MIDGTFEKEFLAVSSRSMLARLWAAARSRSAPLGSRLLLVAAASGQSGVAALSFGRACLTGARARRQGAGRAAGTWAHVCKPSSISES
jgi:hypothetical protein